MDDFSSSYFCFQKLKPVPNNFRKSVKMQHGSVSNLIRSFFNFILSPRIGIFKTTEKSFLSRICPPQSCVMLRSQIWLCFIFPKVSGLLVPLLYKAELVLFFKLVTKFSRQVLLLGADCFMINLLRFRVLRS